MDLERLAEFVAVAQHGTLKEAAFSLGLSVATLSARLIRFEERLGTQLFLRTPTNMVLTDSGRHLLPNALEILSQYRTIRQDMHRAKDHSYHKLRIAVTGTSLPLHLGPFLDRLILDHPDMQLDLLDDSHCSIAESIISGEADLYFGPTLNEPVPRNLVRHVIGSPGEFVLLPKSHRLADRSMISIRELDGEQFILYPKTAEPAKTMPESVLGAHLTGTVVALADVRDDAFASGALGLGVAVEPTEGKLLAPADGTIDMVFDTRHAVGMTTAAGAELLMHIGIDTVKLGGQHFTAHVQPGQAVKKGELLVSFDMEAIRAAGFPLTTPMIVCNSDDYTAVEPLLGGAVQAGADLLKVR